MSARDILHVDMNAFYCSCHAAEEPDKYEHRPTAVAGNPKTRHGILVTASYEARALGVRATMTVREALRICPHLLLIEPNFVLYRHYSRLFFDIVRRFTPLVEVVSIDECFADVTQSHLFGEPQQLAKTLQTALWDELHLPASVGIGDNKFLAKMASDFRKPRGCFELRRDRLEQDLWPLAIRQMYGVGERSASRFVERGVCTIGDLARLHPAEAKRWFGARGVELQQWASGEDLREVQPHPGPPKSIGHSTTLASDCRDLEEMRRTLLNLADGVGRRTRKRNLVGRTVQLTVRYTSMETITRVTTLKQKTDLTEDIYHAAQQLLRAAWNGKRPVRLLGVALGQLSPYEDEEEDVQLTLFDVGEGATGSSLDALKRKEKRHRLSQVTDALRDKYGENIVMRGRMALPSESNRLRDKKHRGTSLERTDEPD
ncbi:DNA polymerase IV [Alicyclobacillus sp. SP_1]|uniref:DNA polymerase IV n=1 Tax=Alicyclobacillus sp. SP_1 TaxID=2942475 RepID=UPI0021578C1E|nr:DNA polymerase IV [Alicyclobacillus sp. SP_1]